MILYYCLVILDDVYEFVFKFCEVDVQEVKDFSGVNVLDVFLIFVMVFLEVYSIIVIDGEVIGMFGVLFIVDFDIGVLWFFCLDRFFEVKKEFIF